jgi:hypothetical protein
MPKKQSSLDSFFGTIKPMKQKTFFKKEKENNANNGNNEDKDEEVKVNKREPPKPSQDVLVASKCLPNKASESNNVPTARVPSAANVPPPPP